MSLIVKFSWRKKRNKIFLIAFIFYTIFSATSNALFSWMSGGISISRDSSSALHTKWHMDIIFLFLIIICEPTTGCTSYKRYNLIIRRQPRNTLVLTNVYNKSSLCRLLTLLKIFHLPYTYHLLQFLSKNCLYTSFILGLQNIIS